MYHNRYRKFISSPNSSRPHTRSKSPYFSSKNKAFSPAQAQTTPKYPSNNKNERPRTPLYCTAEPGSQEWRQYQADRLRAIRDLKEKRKETETLLNQVMTHLIYLKAINFTSSNFFYKLYLVSLSYQER